MFSELCRETLRKAAVCYGSSSSGRSSPSPSASPPPSPSKEPPAPAPKGSPKRPVETRDVGCGSRFQDPQQPCQDGYLVRRSCEAHCCSATRKRPAKPTSLGARRTSSGLESRDGRRPPYAATLDYSFYYSNDWQSCCCWRTRRQPAARRRPRSASPEMLLLHSADYYHSEHSSSESEHELSDDNSSSGDEAGATFDESQRANSAHNRQSLTKEQTMHWFAQIGSDEDAILASDLRRRNSNDFDADSLDGDHPYEYQGRDSTGTSSNGAAAGGGGTTVGGGGVGIGVERSNSAKELLDRARLVRERQQEERQRKLDELRQQALAAQRFREQREEERRKRIEELRLRDNDRRSQVEERKRLIWEAERDRREAIVRKNQEREARIEAKRKNERSQIVFAFGSSTPRMLEPADTGGASFWGTRRATSTSNVMFTSLHQTSSSAGQAAALAAAHHQHQHQHQSQLTRRSSERELDGSKKRATSAGGIDRKPDMRMSSSMYEVFNWNSAPDPSLTPARATNKRASLSLPPTTDVFSIDDLSYNPPTQRGDNEAAAAAGGGGGGGGESAAAAAGIATRYVNRRRTDLVPTLPSPRECREPFAALVGGSGRSSSLAAASSGSKAFSRSPGRTYSMSRLDQLAQPRKRLPAPAATLAAEPPHALGAPSMSRSMSHLARAQPGAARELLQPSSQLRRTDNSRSMGALPCMPSYSGRARLGGLSLAQPRPTRAERLRRKAREHASQGMRSGEVTPNSPSRPHSSMSQQSASSSVASSTVNLRPRTGTPRRPRPASIAGTGVTSFQHNEARQQKDAKPPLPKVHSSSSSANTPRKPTTPAANSNNNNNNNNNTPTTKPERKSAPALPRSAKASPRVTPKPTPLQSPGIEMPPHEIKELAKIEPPKIDDKPVCDVKPAIEEPVISEPSQDQVQKEELVVLEETPVASEVVEPQQPEKKEEAKVSGKKSPEPELKSETADLDEQCDMTASMIQKIRITTEEEAKAALAERRRLAREQAEREAELERQRLEEEERLEAERLCAEEEEQRRLEEETIRLAEEARLAEEQRLQQAIEEAKKREEEDRKRREEELRQKLEKEEAERKAREEAEKQRLEMVERLKKEEEERNARRKRVEAIMSRTRAKNQPNAQKGEGNDGEKSKEDSPSEESKSGPGDDKSAQNLMTTSLLSEATQQLISSEQRAHEANEADVVRNGTSHPSNGVNDPATKQQQQPPQPSLLDNEDLNGHHNNGSSHGNGIDTQSIALDNATVKQNNVTNNLLDLSEFDLLSNSNSTPILMSNNNEDNVNSNLNPTAIPFSPNFGMPATTNANPFQDPFVSNKQQDNQVQDLLS